MRCGVRPIADFPGYYAGEDGLIYSTWGKGPNAQPDTKEPRPMIAGRSSNGAYLGIALKGFGKSYSKMVHSVIAEAWLGPRPSGKECSHLNGDGHDNRPINLTWESREKNLSRRVEHGTHDRGLNNSRSLGEAKVRKIKQMLLDGVNQYTIANAVGVSQQTVSRINTGQRYSEVDA